jgi:hypothetical protein
MAFSTQNGTLIIPDITGYTEFLAQVDLVHGQHIIAELLELLMEGNQLQLELSEIEGDAILFYKMGAPISLTELESQVKRWFTDFHRKLARMRQDIFCNCGACANLGALSLKFVVHYGEIGNFPIGGRNKLIGKDVVLAHRLLKNSLDLREYFLLTEEAFQASHGLEPDKGTEHQEEYLPLEDQYPVFGAVSSRYLNLAPFLESLAKLPMELNEMPKTDSYLFGEINFSGSMERTVWALTDLDATAQWTEGVQRMIYDRTQPMGKGHHHICVINGKNNEVTVDTIAQTGDKFVISFRIKPPILILKNLYRTMRVKKEGQNVRVEFFMYYSRRPLVGRLFDWVIAPQLQRDMLASLDNLQRLVVSAQETKPTSSSVA